MGNLFWLFSLLLVNLAQATVTCTTETINAFSNPSFETGDLTGWETLKASLAASDGSVISGATTDGNDFYPASSSRPLIHHPSPLFPPTDTATSIARQNSTSTTFAISTSTDTSTMLTTRTKTIIACPSTIPNCPASSPAKTVTTETIIVSTTICPVTDINTGTATVTVTPTETTSTVFSTRTATITACPASVAHCPASQLSTYVTTEMVLVSVTVCPVTAVEMGAGAATETDTATVNETSTGTGTAIETGQFEIGPSVSTCGTWNGNGNESSIPTILATTTMSVSMGPTKEPAGTVWVTKKVVVTACPAPH
ncbi:hypothetical protein BJX99DRAFT_256794 [Aspergillus californicus]